MYQISQHVLLDLLRPRATIDITRSHKTLSFKNYHRHIRTLTWLSNPDGNLPSI